MEGVYTVDGIEVTIQYIRPGVHEISFLSPPGGIPKETIDKIDKLLKERIPEPMQQGGNGNGMDFLELITDEKEHKPADISGAVTSMVDIRDDYDEMAYVKDGILYRKGNIVQVWWDKLGKETWTSSSEEQAKESFITLKERWE